ncbi:MAG: hypothetical protein KBH93_06440 [Anaerolineae bacterium]|nr:hypothetical protein [Anaerolineae bacterium]
MRPKIAMTTILLTLALFLTAQAGTAAPSASLEIYDAEGGTCNGTPPTTVFISYSLAYYLPAGQLYSNITSEGGTYSIGPSGSDQSYSGLWDMYTATLNAQNQWWKKHTIYKGATPDTGVDVWTQITYDCTGKSDGQLAEITVTSGAAEPGCDALLPIPATAVGGTFVADAPVYWAPGQLTSPLVTITAGNSARVIGVDASGQYYKIIWVCDFVWVPVGTIGPNYDDVWHGAPLPTAVVD